ncbi:MAG: hypothetical protein P4M11_02470 [Candidatus Pacebacteria bacterium]|nr:hypothetical protein [Candidatus Paceibacterota bacterium]
MTTQNEGTDPVREKSYRIHRSGRDRLLRGDVKLFAGHPHGLADRFLAAATFTTEDVLEFATRVAEPFGFLEDCGTGSYCLAGLDFPLHTTIGEACIHGNAASREEGFSRAARSIETMCPCIRELCGTELVFDYAFFDGGNICITQLGSMGNLPGIRSELVKAYTELGMTDADKLLIQDLVHATVARVRIAPETGTAKELLRSIEQLQNELAADPLRLTIAKIVLRPTIEFLTDRPV